MPAMFKIILAMVIWGSLGVFVRHINLPSMEIAFLRALIAVIVLSLAFLTIKNKNMGALRKNLPVLMLSGAAIGLNWVLLFQAYRYTTISNATLTYYLAPVLIILLSPFVLHEKLSLHKIMAVIGGVVGLAFVLSQQSSGVNIKYQHSIGVAYGLSAALLYAAVILVNKRIKDIDGFQMTLIQLATSAITLLPFVLARNELEVAKGDIIYILILGVIHTGVAYVLYFSGLKQLKAQNVALLSYLDPISAVLFGTLLLNEPMNFWQAIGGLLILGSACFGTKEKKEEAMVERTL